MTTGASIDGVLVQWGERLFYPSNRIARTAPPAHLSAGIRNIQGEGVERVVRAANVDVC